MRFILQFILKILAKLTVTRYRPRIVGITGSVGKTGSRMAIASVLRTKFSVGEPGKNLNNEIGLPLAILREPDSGYRNVFVWICIFSRALWRLLVRDKKYPEVLVLEYGIDHPGDMDYLLSIAEPEVGVVTAVSETHLEFLKTIEGVAQEKGKLVISLSSRQTAVLNMDFPEVAALAIKIKAKLVKYGEQINTDVRAGGISMSQDTDGILHGVSFRLTIGGSTVPVLIRGAIGKPVVAMAMAAASVAYAMGLSTLEITRGLAEFVPPVGRLRVLPGVRGSLIIDDTYNSSPEAVQAALEALFRAPSAEGVRRWAVLGDMLELGSDSEALHRSVGELVAKLKIDFLVTVGERSRDISRAAMTAGLAPDHTWHVGNSIEVGHTIKDKLHQGDIVLIKGSQGVRCERITRELMAEPEKAKELLVRQYAPWI